MDWRITHDPADDAPSPDYAVPARSHEAQARRRRHQRPLVDPQ